MIVYHSSFKLSAVAQNGILNNPIANDGVNGTGFWVSSKASATEAFGNVLYSYEFPDELLEQCTHHVIGGNDTWAIPSELTSKLVPLGKSKRKMFRVDTKMRKGYISAGNEGLIPNAPYIHLDGGNLLAETFFGSWMFDDMGYSEGFNTRDANAHKFGQPVNICIDMQMRINSDAYIYPKVLQSLNDFVMGALASAGI